MRIRLRWPARIAWLRRNKAKFYLFLLLLIGTALTYRFAYPVKAAYVDTEKISCVLTAGTWNIGNGATINGISPCWGKAGHCRWPVIIRGKGFRRGAKAALRREGWQLEAVKTWFLNEGLLYAVFDLRSVPTGGYDMLLYWPDGCQAVLPGGFRVQAGCVLSSGLDPSGFIVVDERVMGDTTSEVGAPSPSGKDEASGEAETTVGKPASQGSAGGKGVSSDMTPDRAGESATGTLVWLKRLGQGGLNTLRLTSNRPLGCGLARAYAMSPGFCVEGVIRTGGDSTVSISFDLGLSFPKVLDVVLFTPLEEPILLTVRP